MSNAVAIGWLGLTNKEAIAKYEQHCKDNAAYFTAIRGMSRNRIRAEFNTFDEAIAYAESYGDRRTMIYAVTCGGNSTLVKTA